MQSGYYIEQRIQGLNTFLFEVERGNFPSDVSFTADDEFHEVERKSNRSGSSIRGASWTLSKR